MGGIAIAASLAAFLIYGPHPAAVEIPGIGNLRLDHDEQGYGRTLPEEAAREPARTRARAPVEMSSEILAADAVAVPGQPTPLAITIRSPQPAEKMLVSIAGVPEGARLSAGVDTGGGNWLVAPRRLNGLTINLPAGSPDVVSLEAQTSRQQRANATVRERNVRHPHRSARRRRSSGIFPECSPKRPGVCCQAAAAVLGKLSFHNANSLSTSSCWHGGCHSGGPRHKLPRSGRGAAPAAAETGILGVPSCFGAPSHGDATASALYANARCTPRNPSA